MIRSVTLLAATLAALGCAAGSRVVVTRQPPISPVELSRAGEPVPPAPTAAPTSTLQDLPGASVPPPAAMPEGHLQAPLVRVLLKRSSSEVVLPQPGRAYAARAGKASAVLNGPLTIAPHRERGLWQVGAFRDAATAEGVARRLRQGLGPDADVSSASTDDGLIRVRVRDAGDGSTRTRLAELGFGDAFELAGDSGLMLRDGGGKAVLVTDEMVLEPLDDWPTAVGSTTYHGRFRLRVVDGSVLLVNELNLESYLAGVVPVEMGPYQFPELEALKAQAVAARTYAVAHLGDHDDEGWDLCATPACQAYGGVSAEHALSSRAVAETAGLVATFAGEPIDAMYTSTCGGHTEDAARIFADRAQPYLRGVSCSWERELSLAGDADNGPWRASDDFMATLTRRALALAPEAGVGDLLAAVAAACGGVPPSGAPATADEYVRGLLSAAGLDTAGEILPSGDDGVGALLQLSDLVEVPLALPTGQWTVGWWLEAAGAALQVQGVLTRDRGEAVPHPDGVAIYPRRADRSEALPAKLPLFEGWNGAYRPLAAAAVPPGTTLERWRRGDRLLALVVLRSGGGGEADRRSAWRSWIRDRSWPELEASLGMSGLERLRIAERASSGRVVGLEAVDGAGGVKRFSGFDVRRALDLPETLFSFHTLVRDDGSRVVRFIGRGWGHGIGLCQNGAYGLARAGQTFDRILATYYTGVEIRAWAP